MKISDIFSLGKEQNQLDFADIDVSRDIPLFIDPYFLSLRQDRWSGQAVSTIQSFFQNIVDLVRQGDIGKARSFFDNMHEDNSTCLGVSGGNPQGRGVGSGNGGKLFDNILRSRAIQTGMLKHLEDNVLFVEDFGKDGLSDMTTAIIKKHLLEYTKSQCRLNGIPLTADVPSGFFWNEQTQRWEQELIERLVVNGKPITLVPKGIVSFARHYTAERYYQHFMLNFMQNEHLSLKSSLVKTVKKTGNAYVTKKDLAEQYPFSKKFVLDFSLKHPEVLEEFRRRSQTEPLRNDQISQTDLSVLTTVLVDELKAINSGGIDATKFHKWTTGVLELLFYPHLINPKLEREIHEGRKRIDITFDNAAEKGIFKRLHDKFKLPCAYLMVECKNYSTDPVNPEFDQLAGRFSPNRGQVGLLLCRSLGDRSRAIKRCQDTYKDSRGLIIVLTDEDLITLLENHDKWENDFIETFLSDRVREITMS